MVDIYPNGTTCISTGPLHLSLNQHLDRHQLSPSLKCNGPSSAPMNGQTGQIYGAI